jgi:hypothetical protein
MLGWFTDANPCAPRPKRAMRCRSFAKDAGRALNATSWLSLDSLAQ